MSYHCRHWQEGDGDCCHCNQPTWCTDSGETPENLAEAQKREATCTHDANEEQDAD